MQFRDDDRAQSLQVGAILLFGILIIALTTYQTTVVPQQNAEIEYNHNQAVGMDVLDLRNDLLTTSRTGRTTATTVQLGTRYPARALFLNPPPPSGNIGTVGTANDGVNVSIGNATADGIVGEYWEAAENGTGTRSFNTGTIVYSPNYNEYRNAPDTGIDVGTGIVYNAQEDTTITLTGQQLIEGDRINLVLLTGDLRKNGGYATSFDVRPVSSSENTVEIENESDERPITISLATALSNDTWTRLLEDETRVSEWEHDPAGGPDDFALLTVTLEPGDYTLRMAKVSVGSHVGEEDAAYITTVGGSTFSIQNDTSQTLVAEVRDQYNNPVSGRTVNATVISGDGTLTDPGKTDADGQVRFQYNAPNGSTDAEIEVDISDSPNNAETATFTVDVTAGGGSSGGGAYSLKWLNPSSTGDNPDAALSDCSASSCTWDVGASDSTELTLRSGTDPGLEGLDVEFAVDNTTVGTVTPNDTATDASGEVTTSLSARENGTIDVYTASGGASDKLTVIVENLTGEAGDPLPDGNVAFNDANGNGVYDDDTETSYTDADIGDMDLDGVDLVISEDVETDKIDQKDLANLTIEDGVTVETTDDKLKFEVKGGSIDVSGATLIAGSDELKLKVKEGDGDINIKDARLQSDGNIKVEGNGGSSNDLFANDNGGTEADVGTYIVDNDDEATELDTNQIDTTGAQLEKGTFK